MPNCAPSWNDSWTQPRSSGSGSRPHDRGLRHRTRKPSSHRSVDRWIRTNTRVVRSGAEPDSTADHRAPSRRQGDPTNTSFRLYCRQRCDRGVWPIGSHQRATYRFPCREWNSPSRRQAASPATAACWPTRPKSLLGIRSEQARARSRRFGSVRAAQTRRPQSQGCVGAGAEHPLEPRASAEPDPNQRPPSWTRNHSHSTGAGRDRDG